MVSRGKDGALRVDAGQAAMTAVGQNGSQQRQLDDIQSQVAKLGAYLEQLGGV